MVPAPICAVVDTDDHKSPDDVVSIIYLINTTDQDFVIKTKADFFQTVDEETGKGITHGPKAKQTTLKANSYAKVGDILGWELDSCLGFDVFYKGTLDEEFIHLSYNFRGGKECKLPLLDQDGSVYEGMII